jgi:hypothetical protein
MPDHVAKKNDHLLFIAKENNIPLQKLKDANAELKRNPNLLFKGDDWSDGDAVKIPAPESKEAGAGTGKTTAFEIDPTKLFLRLRVLNEDFTALKNADYELTIESSPAAFSKKGKTDGSGQIETEIPPKAQKGVLSVSVPPPDGQKGAGKSAMTWELQIGALNPILEKAPDDECVSGVQARLNNLAFPCGDVNGVSDETFEGQVKGFRKTFGLPDGKASDATLQNKLKEIHDAPDKIVKPAT